ncbi:unnamed protein product [Clavelina lepadiformis]|uniref:Carbohydrate sulfotransferase n=1 Tax=Clavelina lepadiformis TaxID=159417 RepID=A0ABP0G2Z7_CLALP
MPQLASYKALSLAIFATFLLLYLQYFYLAKIKWRMSRNPHFRIHPLSTEEPYRSRIRGIRGRCREGGGEKNKTLLRGWFKFNDRLKLVFCKTPKVASTTWQYLFLRLGGFPAENITEEKRRSWLLSKIPNKDFKELTTEAEAKVRLREFTTFFITRHPFERLVSCYTDKFTNHSDLRVYRDKYGVQIAAEQATDHLHGLERMFRTNLRLDLVKRTPTFRKLSKSQQAEVLRYWEVLRSGEISFPQFIKFIIDRHRDGSLMDVHWRPQVSMCMPCHFDYSYVMKFENIAEDSNRLLDYIQDNGSHVPLKEKITFPTGHSSLVQNSRTQQAFDQISETDVETLRRIYADDFYILNYDPYLYQGRRS